MNEEKSKKAKKYFDNVSIGGRTKQSAYFVQNHDKKRLFVEMLDGLKEKRILVLLKSKRRADELMEYLKEKEIRALCAHGNHRASEIEATAAAFNLQESKIFITTDKILEKLSLHDIDIVLNYDLPMEVAEYFKGLVLVDERGEGISFVDPDDEAMLAAIEQKMKHVMDEVEQEGFLHTKAEQKEIKDKTKKPRHKKVEQRAKRKAEIKSKWVPSK
jgi:ATP-dependent RNA helicase RhlE